VVAVSTPTYGTTLDASVEEILNYAVANMDALGVDGLLELVAVYGPRRGFAEWRDRRRRRRKYLAAAEKES
jgi:hypothetical protein